MPAVRLDNDDSTGGEKLGTSRWWTLKDDAAPAALWGWIDRLRSRHRAHALMDLVHEAIYEDRPLGSSSDVSAAAYLRREASAPASLNITRSMVDTVVARLGKRRPMPCISADDAGWSEKRFAQRASRVLRRKMGQAAVERMCPTALRSAVIRGTGVAKVYSRNGDVCVEEVPRYELVVDPRDARYGTPRTMAQVKLASRDVLASRFPKSAKAIAAAPVVAREFWEVGVEDLSVAPDQIEVSEAWHLPSAPNAGDGGHIISIRGKVLFSEKWTRERFPFAFMHWSAPTRGFWGHGLVEDLRGIQAKVNDLARDTQQALYLASALRVFIQRGSNVIKNHLRTREAAVVEYDGAMPTYIAPSPVSPQVIQFLEWLVQQAYQISGISQASAASKNPLGSNASGKALDTMYDLESDRFSHVELQYAMFRVDIGHCMLDEARAIANDNADPKARKASWISEIEWTKVDVDSGDYHLILEPVNFLTDSRSGKLDQVNDLAKAGILSDPMQTAALFDEPDLVRANRHLLGPYRLLERIMEDLANVDADLEPLTPTPYMLAFAPLAKSMALGELCNVEAEKKNDQDEVIAGRFRWFLDMLKAANDEATAQAAPPQMAGPPGADPDAPPMPGPPGAPPPGMPMIPADAMGGMASQAAAGMPVPMQVAA